MQGSVGILGIYRSKLSLINDDQNLEEMIYHACKSALKDACMEIDEVDSIMMASSDQVDGRAISMMLTAGSCGSYLRNALNTSSNGDHALVLGCLKILSGLSDVCLVASWSKTSEAPIEQVENLGAEPFFTRPLGTSAISLTAMQVAAYVNTYEIDEKVAAEIVVKNRNNAVYNPFAHIKQKVTAEEVIASPEVAMPLKELHLPPKSDGVCVLILVSERKSRQISNRELSWINGFGWARDSFWLSERNLKRIESLETAAKQAYSMAGISNPKTQIDFAEVDEITAYHELMIYEALGFEELGKGYELIKNGTTYSHGKLPVNASGGTLASNPYFTTGLMRVVDTVSQLRGQAGSYQLPSVSVGLAHSSDPFAAQGNSVFVIGYHSNYN